VEVGFQEEILLLTAPVELILVMVEVTAELDILVDTAMVLEAAEQVDIVVLAGMAIIRVQAARVQAVEAVADQLDVIILGIEPEEPGEELGYTVRGVMGQGQPIPLLTPTAVQAGLVEVQAGLVEVSAAPTLV
jgi:hypothetical protein